jgi:hypothetical protein
MTTSDEWEVWQVLWQYARRAPLGREALRYAALASCSWRVRPPRGAGSASVPRPRS